MHRDRKTLVLWVGAALLVAATSYLVWQQTRPEPWAPLYGPTSGQVITAQTADYIDVRGQKCNADDESVLVRGIVYAQPVSPPGIPIKVSEGQGVRLAGCTQIEFRNVYPDQLVDYTSRTDGPVVWHFFGDETPIGVCSRQGAAKPDGVSGKPEVVTTKDLTFLCWRRSPGVTWSWTTENFTYPPDTTK